MCNAYRIPAKKARDGLAAQVHEVAATLPSRLIRKTDNAPVVVTGARVEPMRWGFFRSFNQAINNARIEKLESGMWQESFADRRCVIPMSLFYEWGAAPGSGRKQAHEITTDGWMWAAGVWEEHPELGPCFSMITRPANPTIATLHHRMPALLAESGTADFLNHGNLQSLPPFTGELRIRPCDSPLTSKPPDTDQPELW